MKNTTYVRSFFQFGHNIFQYHIEGNLKREKPMPDGWKEHQQSVSLYWSDIAFTRVIYFEDKDIIVSSVN